MDIDLLLLLLIISGAAYFAGYATIALAVLVLTGLFFLGGGRSKKPSYYSVPAGGVRVHGAEMLEPIVVETTKGAPFRIPKQMDMRVNPKWSAYNRVEKMTFKGLGAFGRLVHGTVFGRKWD